MAGKLRSTWLQALKKSFHAYRANAVAHMLDYVYSGKVNLMINDRPLGKPFNLATDARQKETAKHSERYFDDLLSSISGQLT